MMGNSLKSIKDYLRVIYEPKDMVPDGYVVNIVFQDRDQRVHRRHHAQRQDHQDWRGGRQDSGSDPAQVQDRGRARGQCQWRE